MISRGIRQQVERRMIQLEVQKQFKEGILLGLGLGVILTIGMLIGYNIGIE